MNAPAPLNEQSQAPLLWSRLGSLLAVLPLGLWTVNHLWDNLSAFRGGEAWQSAVTRHPHPVAQFFTYTVVLLPLALHSVWGVQRMLRFRPNNPTYRSYGNLKYLLQRLSAAGVLLFLGAHLWLALIHPRVVMGQAETFADIAGTMRFHTPTLVVYLLGTLGVAYHLANGLFGFGWTWGLMSGRRAFKLFDRVSLLAFVVLLGMAWGAIYALWSAGAEVGPPAEHAQSL